MLYILGHPQLNLVQNLLQHAHYWKTHFNPNKIKSKIKQTLTQTTNDSSGLEVGSSFAL